MALASLVGGYEWIPAFRRFTQNQPFVIDASGEIAAAVCRCPRTGNIQGLECLVSAVGNAPDNGLRASLRALGTDGLPSATILGGGNAAVTMAGGNPSAAGWLNPGNFTAVYAATKGELFAAVLDIPSFTAGDSVTVAGIDTVFAGQFPFGVLATSTRNDALPMIVFRYDDGLFVPLARDAWPVNDIDLAFTSIDTGTTPDEIGLAFTLNAPRRLGAVLIQCAVEDGADFDVVVYDSGGSVVGGTGGVTQEGDAKVATGGFATGDYMIIFEDDVDCTAGALYRVVIKPTTLNNIAVYYATFQSLALMDGAEGGQDFYMTERTDAGAWTDYNSGTFRRPRMSLGFSAVDDAVGGGSGGGMRLAGHGGLAA